MSGIYDEFGGSLTADVLSYISDAIPAHYTLFIHMTRGERRIADELRKAFGRFERVVIDVDGERNEFSADSLIRLLESYESYSQVPELGKRENGGERESYATQECHATQANYEHCKYSTDRGWCDTSRYAELFGTPERAARTLAMFSPLACSYCALYSTCGDDQDKECLLCDCDALLEWLRGESE